MGMCLLPVDGRSRTEVAHLRIWGSGSPATRMRRDGDPWCRGGGPSRRRPARGSREERTEEEVGAAGRLAAVRV
nr:unnamed protein product [Digitaria exilis]